MKMLGMSFQDIIGGINFLKDFLSSPKIVGFNTENIVDEVLDSKYILQHSEMHCFNLIRNNILIDNKKDHDIIIEKITLTNVKVDETYTFADLRFHCGLDMANQVFQAFVFNNGNRSLWEEEYKVQFFKQVLQGENQLIKEYKHNISSLKRGEIERVANEDLNRSILINSFDNSKDQLLVLKISDKSCNEIYEMVIPYNEKDKIFCTNLGKGVGEENYKEQYFEIINPYETEYSMLINKKIPEGESKISFNIFVDKTCQLTYDVEIFYKGKAIKNISNVSMSHSTNIRIPCYKDISLYKGLGGNIYTFCYSKNLPKTNYEEVEKHGKEILNKVQPPSKTCLN